MNNIVYHKGRVVHGPGCLREPYKVPSLKTRTADEVYRSHLTVPLVRRLTFTMRTLKPAIQYYLKADGSEEPITPTPDRQQIQSSPEFASKAVGDRRQEMVEGDIAVTGYVDFKRLCTIRKNARLIRCSYFLAKSEADVLINSALMIRKACITGKFKC